LNNLQDFHLIELNDSYLSYFKDSETIEQSTLYSDFDLSRLNLTVNGFQSKRNINDIDHIKFISLQIIDFIGKLDQNNLV
jgi:hypothetical protein